MAYINQKELVEVIQLHYDGTLDQIPCIEDIYKDPREWYWDNQLRGLVCDDEIATALQNIDMLFQQTLLYVFTGSEEALEAVQHYYNQDYLGEFDSFDHFLCAAKYKGIEAVGDYLLKNVL